ncbi:MAG: hypothetical protein AAF092_10260 [Pseudomonadota bacterium]
MGIVARWSAVIVTGVVLYMAATYAADALGWADGMGRTLGLGAGVGLFVGGLAGALGLIGDSRD